MHTVRKDPFRFARYVALLFRTEVLEGDAAKRRRFFSRIFFRTAPKLGLYAIMTTLFMTSHAVRCAFMPAATRAEAWRNRRWLWATSSLEDRDYLRAWLTARHEGGPKVVIIGMGSIGDILQITPLLRILRERMPTAQIALLHRSPIAKTVLRGSPYVNSIAAADFFQFAQIRGGIETEGAADLAVQIQSTSYVVSYSRAPKELRHPDFDRLMPEEIFARADAFRSTWHKDTPPLPPKGAPYAWPAQWRGYQFLDILGATSGLPIDRNSALEFHTAPADEGILARLPKGKPFVTVQNGADTDVVGWSRATGLRPTKLLPRATWGQIVALLRAKGFTVVQLGTADDEAVANVSLDLRGHTTLAEAAVVLREAYCHVGTEGGLTHLARAVNTRAVVMFGPTAAEFFGYAQNINLAAGDCAACCWSGRDWFIYCPRGFAEPICMQAHRAETVVEAVQSLGAKARAKTAVSG